MMSSSESVADFGDETPAPRGIVLLPDLPSFCESLRFFVATSMPAGLIEVWLAKRRRRVELNRFLTWLSVLSMIGLRGVDKGQPILFRFRFGASVRMETSLEKRAEVVTPNRLFAQVAVSIFPFRWKVTES